MENNLSNSYGVHLAVEIKSECRPFKLIDEAADRYHLTHRLPDKPNKFTALSRAVTYLMRTCAASIGFPAWSQHANWTEERPVTRMVKGVYVKTGTQTVALSGRNPNYSLKITQVKQMHVDASVTWRFNIANRNKSAENLGHVISVTYDRNIGVFYTQGTDPAAFNNFGKEIQEIIDTEYNRFLNNYDDTDIRKIFDAELYSINALRIIKKCNVFVSREYIDRAKALYNFAKDINQTVSWLGLDNSPETRESLLEDLKASIFSDMEEYEAVLEDKLNPKNLERKRGEKQRERMFNTAMENIDKIMALADYHSTVLGVMSAEITKRRDALRTKAYELLTKDFNAVNPVPTVTTEVLPANLIIAGEAAPRVVTNPDEVF